MSVWSIVLKRGQGDKLDISRGLVEKRDEKTNIDLEAKILLCKEKSCKYFFFNLLSKKLYIVNIIVFGELSICYSFILIKIL